MENAYLDFEAIACEELLDAVAGLERFDLSLIASRLEEQLKKRIEEEVPAWSPSRLMSCFRIIAAHNKELTKEDLKETAWISYTTTEWEKSMIAHAKAIVEILLRRAMKCTLQSLRQAMDALYCDALEAGMLEDKSKEWGELPRIDLRMNSIQMKDFVYEKSLSKGMALYKNINKPEAKVVSCYFGSICLMYVWGTDHEAV